MFEPCEQMLFWANAGGSVAVTASIVVCVPPVSGGGVEDVGGQFPSMDVLPQLVIANVAAAKTIKHRARVVFSVSAGTEQDDIVALSLMCRNDLRSHPLVLAGARCHRETPVMASVGGDCCDCGVDGSTGVWRAASFTSTPSGCCPRRVLVCLFVPLNWGDGTSLGWIAASWSTHCSAYGSWMTTGWSG